MDLYAQNVMDHYKNPHNVGNLNDATVTHQEVNTSCGDEISIDLQIDGDFLVDVKFIGTGCAISQASISMMTDMVKSMELQKVLDLTEEDIQKMLGVPISYRRTKCALLSLLTIKNAILKHQVKDQLKWYDLAEGVDEE